jgi:uncharacterized protein (DUF433 family)
MTEVEMSYALFKQLPTAHTIASSYGEIELDDELRAALQYALRPILEERLAAARGAP